MSRFARHAALLLLVLLGSGCERSMHDMYEQPRYRPLAPSPLWADGNSARHPPAGAVPAAQGERADTSSGRRGGMAAPRTVAAPVPLDAHGNSLLPAGRTPPDESMPRPPDMAMLVRGRERYEIFCAPCHGLSGDGDGIIVRRGFPAPPSYHTDKLRQAPDAHLYRVISRGYGIMYPYGDRIAPADRWAIVAYVRALQLSQHAPVATLPARDRARLADTQRSRQ